MLLEEIYNNRDNLINMERIIKSGVPCYQCWGFATQDSNLKQLTVNEALTLLPNYVPHTMLNGIRTTNRNGIPGIIFQTLTTSDLY